MTLSRIRMALAVVAILTLARGAEAGWSNHVMRSLGLGWSDGYHACSHCNDAPAGASPYVVPGSYRELGPEQLPAPVPRPTPAMPTPEAPHSPPTDVWQLPGFSATRHVPLPSNSARPAPPPGRYR